MEIDDEFFKEYLPFIASNKRILSFVNLNDDIAIKIKNNNNQIITLFLNETFTTKQILEIISQKFGLSTIIQFDNKFDIVILGSILENIVDPINFLNILRNLLHSSGKILFHVRNAVHGSSRIEFLNGNFLQSRLNHFTLDSVLILLDETGYKLDSLHKLQQDLLENPKLIHYSIPKELIDAIKFDPESTPIYYIICGNTCSKNNKHIRKSLTDFPNTMCSEYLRNIMFYYRNQLNNPSRSANQLDDTLLNQLVNDIEILQKTNIENRKLIDHYVSKINQLVSEIDLLQKINLQHQETIKQRDQKIKELSE